MGLLADLFHVTAGKRGLLPTLEPVGELSHIHIPFPEDAFDTGNISSGSFGNHTDLDKRISHEDNGGLRARTAPEGVVPGFGRHPEVSERSEIKDVTLSRPFYIYAQRLL